jgi:hypothetical protein
VKALAALLAAAAVLLAVELGMGAAGFGGSLSKDPCSAHSAYPGHGLDAAVQRVVIDGLYGAACELGTTREELVLSFSPSGARKIRWDPATIQRAVRAGLERSIAEAERRGTLPGPAASVLRFLVRHAPVRLLVEGSELLGTLLPG